jgi:hypothetical protein
MAASPDAERLRVAVLVPALTVPGWVEWAIARVDDMDGCDLTAIVTAGPVQHGPGAAERLHRWADERVFGAPAAMRPADLEGLATGRAAPAADAPLDVVVSFLPAERSVWAGPVPRHGVWALAPVDAGGDEGADARFRDVSRGSETAAVALVAVAGGRARVIARAEAHADPLSLARTRDAAAWESARLVVASLQRLARGGRLAPGAAPAAPPAAPSLVATLASTARTAARGAARRTRSALRRDEWFVAVRERSADGRVRGPLRALPNPPGRYLADPFPIAVDGRHYLFVEDFSHAAGRAVISVCEAGADGAWSPPRTVLARDHHVSYPCVFVCGGEIYLLPETAEAGRIELHRAVEFPDRWRLERVLVDGIDAVDATIHVHDGVVWLFANVRQGHGDRGALHLYSAPALEGRFRPHPGNPVVTDPGSARPAGRLYRSGGDLIRPGQDCARRYGGAVVLNRVDVLTPDAYRETAVERIEPDWMPGLDGTHTLTFDSRFECLDGRRSVPHLRLRR